MLHNLGKLNAQNISPQLPVNLSKNSLEREAMLTDWLEKNKNLYVVHLCIFSYLHDDDW